MVQLGQGLQACQHPDRPAIGQIGIQTGGLIDIGAAKGGFGETVHGAALQIIGETPAQLHPPRFRRKNGGELGRSLRGVFGLVQRCGQRKDRRQIRLQLAHHPVKLGLRH